MQNVNLEGKRKSQDEFFNKIILSKEEIEDGLKLLTISQRSAK